MLAAHHAPRLENCSNRSPSPSGTILEAQMRKRIGGKWILQMLAYVASGGGVSILSQNLRSSSKKNWKETVQKKISLWNPLPQDGF